MVVTKTDMQGSIGGGELEHRCLGIAVSALLESGNSPGSSFSRTFPLGPDCGQCCGGVVEVLFEIIDPANCEWLDVLLVMREQGEEVVLITPTDSRSRMGKMLVTSQGGVGIEGAENEILCAARTLLASDESLQQQCITSGNTVTITIVLEPIRKTNFDIVLFGAGHVASALVTILAGLDCDVHWIDSRAELFPPSLPANIRVLPAADPATLVSSMPAGAYYLVMTHSHPLDLELCQYILARDDAAYCGLIGSRSKRNRFEKRLHALLGDGFYSAKLTCPIGAGAGSSSGKKPMEIAVAVATELLCLQQRATVHLDKTVSARPLVSAVKS